jgi:hypothetical protein
MDAKSRKLTSRFCHRRTKLFQIQTAEYREPDYVSLDASNEMAFDRCVKYSLGAFDHRNEASFLIC